MKRRIFFDEDLQKQWDRDNYFVIPFLNPDEIHELKSGLKEIREPGSDLFFMSLWTKDLSNRKQINDFISSIFSRRINQILVDYKPLIHSFAIKKPGAKSNWHIHQDDTFTDESKFDSLSLWIPLVDANETNGTISIVENSHRVFADLRCPTVEKPYRNLLPVIEKNYLTTVPVKAGEALVFGHKLIHASGPNLSSETRTAVVGVYLPTEAPVLFYYKDFENTDGSVNELLLPDDYYLRFPLGEKPTGDEVKLVGKIFHKTEMMTERDWEKYFTPITKNSEI